MIEIRCRRGVKRNYKGDIGERIASPNPEIDMKEEKSMRRFRITAKLAR